MTYRVTGSQKRTQVIAEVVRNVVAFGINEVIRHMTGFSRYIRELFQLVIYRVVAGTLDGD